MKVLLLSLLCLGAFSAFAHEEATVDEMKARMTAHLDERISKLNESKACVTAATTKEALKVCKEKMKQEHKAMREKYREHKDKMKKH